MSSSPIARVRWRLLAEAVRGQAFVSNKDNTKVPRIADISELLFYTRDITEELKDKSINNSRSKMVRWMEYIPKTHHIFDDHDKPEDADKQFSKNNYLQLRMYTSITEHHTTKQMEATKHRLYMLSGFDNTGNVHVWSSELLLAHAFLCIPAYPGLLRLIFSRFMPGHLQRVCELGAGMTGAAGLALCACGSLPEPMFKPSYVLLTDGNERCVESLRANAELQEARFKSQFGDVFRLEARHLSWAIENEVETSELDPSLLHSFDLVLAADCFFNPTGHRGLLQLIDALLSYRRCSAFLAIAPWRGSTLRQFLHLLTTEHHRRWKVTCLDPESYLHPRLLHILVDSFSNLPREAIDDKVLGQLILLERID